ncbi:endonuclease domain-containing protein [Brachybacterium sp. P6-10-X1]|uniref:endonuclease domain-containing protein n=1 Tax=Brachybacterium sp. P6-10-X1 TaxID=1903186 RepID=UPI0009F9A50C|nr:DUF559 domain-containing protein [Brachybacterium sp. P6-10-X1]
MARGARGERGAREKGVVPPRRVFTRAGLFRMGVSARRLSSSEFRRVLPGCYTLEEHPADLREVARVAQRHVVPGGLISHVTAAELLRLPLPEGVTWKSGEPIHCTIEPERKRNSARELTIHVRSGRHALAHEGVQIEDPLGVLLDLASVLDHDDLVACIDSLGSRRREVQRMSVGAIRVACENARAPGVRALRAAIRDAGDWVDSPRETATRLLLLRHGYPEPEANWPVTDPVTGMEYWVDLAYVQRRIAIEYDGKDHFTPEQQRKDHRKDELLHRLGWTVLRITVEDHRNPGDFFALLDEHIRAAASEDDGAAPVDAAR